MLVLVYFIYDYKCPVTSLLSLDVNLSFADPTRDMTNNEWSDSKKDATREGEISMVAVEYT